MLLAPENALKKTRAKRIVWFSTSPSVIPKTLPVLVYIHGGSFLMGSGPISGVGYLIKQNIIVVTINYRLGALGFLCLGVKETPGNAGLKDQVAALNFVNKNIAHFGGNPKNVTLYGMSAGGASVEYLIHSRGSKNLFRQAIIESGSVANPWAFDATPIETARAVAALVNISTEYPKNLYEHFKRLPIETLTKIDFKYYTHLNNGTFGFAPCVEKNIDGVQIFLVKQPHEVLKIVSGRKIPTMFMFSTLEGLYLRSTEFKEQNYKERMELNFFDFMPSNLIIDESLRNETAEKIKRFYFGNSTDTIQYLNFFGDSLILHGFLESVESHARSCNHVYLMEFGYIGEMGSFERLYPDVNMAGHGGCKIRNFEQKA